MTSENITFKLPFPDLTPCEANTAPNAHYVRNLLKELAANAGHVQTTLGGGQCGHLGMILAGADYQALPGVGPANAFVFPVQPPPVVFPAGANVQQRETLTQECKHDVKTFQTANELEGQLTEKPDHCGSSQDLLQRSL